MAASAGSGSIRAGSAAAGSASSCATASPRSAARPSANSPRAAAPSAVPSASPTTYSGRSSVAAITSRHSGDRNAPPVTRTRLDRVQPVELVEDDPQLQADALDRRADEVRAGVVAAQAEVGAGQVGIPQRRALGQQVRQHHEPVAAGGGRRREVEHAPRPPAVERPGRASSPAQRTTTPPLLIAPPTTQAESVSA